ncbi:MAG: phenylalanine--tRNA ligase subunit beta [Firmicutes bacterium]|nr:phenylalanine--tRNA ligase subunit beta [Bacillota bacterium]
MKILYSWLKELVPDLKADAQTVATALTDAGVEVDGLVELPDQEYVIELDLTPNRSDCLSMWGLAYEVAAIFGLKAELPQDEELPILVDANKIQLAAPQLCPYYLGLILEDVKIGPSPDWLVKRLEALGMRGINNIVDITNYVMLETGQPLHAFDYDCLVDHKIVVRESKEDEEIITLDNQLRKPEAGTIYICDPEKAIGIGGVMGGLNSETTEQTKNIFFEAAYFDRRSIRRTAKALDLRSEAALRFEKGVDPSGLYKALQRVYYYSQLLKIGQPQKEILSGSTYAPQADRQILLSRKYLDERIGMSFSDQQVEESLQNLGFALSPTESGWQVGVPSRRQDVQEEVDLTEEVSRLVGLDQLPAVLPEGASTQGGLNKEQKLLQKVHRVLNKRGLNEALNYSFISKKELKDVFQDENHPLLQAIPLKNPMTEAQEIMRTSLLPGLLKNLRDNQNRQNLDIGLYEIGRIYLPEQLPLRDLPSEELHLGVALTGSSQALGWQLAKEPYDFYHLKGILEDLMSVLGWPLALKEKQDDPRFHPYQCAEILFNGRAIGIMGAIHPDLAENWDLNQKAFLAELNLDLVLKLADPKINYKPLSRYQSSKRDLALVVENSISAQAVLATIKLAAGDLLENVELFDVYRGSQIKAGHKSLAFSLTYRAQDRTLTDAEVAKAHNEILQFLNDYYQSELRQ